MISVIPCKFRNTFITFNIIYSSNFEVNAT